MTFWFTADWHLGHSNIIRFCNRPFADLQDMHASILENHNSLVQPTDTVYHLGDISFKMSYKYLAGLLEKFNGKFIIIKGNHDKPAYLRSLQEDKLIDGFYDVLGVSIKNQYIWMSHYPHRSWNKSGHGSWHLYGHAHGNAKPYLKSFDVGVDNWNYYPISFEQVEGKMSVLKELIV
jgi:calcineurin-like phosphoesterase family protein